MLPSTFSTILIYIVVTVDEFSWDRGMFFFSLIMMDQQFCSLPPIFCSNSRKYCRFQPHFSFLSSPEEQNMLTEKLASALVMYSLLTVSHVMLCKVMDRACRGREGGLFWMS